MAYTIHAYLWDSAQLESNKALLHRLIELHSKAVFFATEHSRLLAEIHEAEARMKRYENTKGNR